MTSLQPRHDDPPTEGGGRHQRGWGEVGVVVTVEVLRNEVVDTHS